jgi:ABC-type sugar transport system permease subunit
LDAHSSGLGCISVLVVPTCGTVALSFFDYDVMTAPEFVGGDNYTWLFQAPRFSEALGFTLSSVAVRVAVVALVPLLLALAVNEFGRIVRIPVRLLFTVPLALFAPVVTVLAWGLILHPRDGLVSAISRDLGLQVRPWLMDPEVAKRVVLSIDGLTTFGLACGLGLILYLAALRGPGAQAPSWKAVRKPLVVTWLVGLLATIAFAPQSFVLSFVLTRGGPVDSTMVLALYQYIVSFTRFQFGAGAALGTLNLIVAILFGLGTGLIVVLAGLRLERVPWGKEVGLITRGGKRKVIAVLLLLAMVFIASIGCLLSVLPRTWNVLNSLGLPGAYAEALKGPPPVSIGQAWINTVLPPFVVIFLLQMPVAYLAALGIGALRPLAKRSELLLLLFSPWLFVTVGPLSPAAFLAARQLNLLDTAVAQLPPSLLSVPILFILTLFFKGQEPRWRAALKEGQSPVRALFSTLILPSLPLAMLLAFVSLLFSMQDLLWPLLVLVTPDRWTAALTLVFLNQSGIPLPILAASIVIFGLPVFLFFFLVFGLFQALYLDRLALVAKTSDDVQVIGEPSPPEMDVMEGAVVTEGSVPEGAKKTVRLEPEGARESMRERKTARLEMEEERKTVRLEPASERKDERKTVRLGMEGAKKTVRLEPEGERKTVRLEMEDEGKTARLEQEVDDED